MILVITVVALLAVFPLGMVVYGSFRSSAPGQAGFFTLSGYQAAFTDPTIGKALWATLWLGVVRTFISRHSKASSKNWNLTIWSVNGRFPEGLNPWPEEFLTSGSGTRC
jgi:hypothetical protein